MKYKQCKHELVDMFKQEVTMDYGEWPIKIEHVLYTRFIDWLLFCRLDLRFIVTLTFI